MKRLRLRIYGLVQGVGFRDSCRQKAAELGIAGWVRNEKDRTVFLEAEAEEAALEKFVAWCRQGPEHSRVKKVEIEELDDLKHYQQFIIDW